MGDCSRSLGCPGGNAAGTKIFEDQDVPIIHMKSSIQLRHPFAEGRCKIMVDALLSQQRVFHEHIRVLEGAFEKGSTPILQNKTVGWGWRVSSPDACRSYNRSA